MPFDSNAIVIDCGASTCKLGYSGEDDPLFVFPSLLYTKKHRTKLKHKIYIGEEAIERANPNHLVSPFHLGIVSDWDTLQKIFYHSFFSELRHDPSDIPIIITEPPLNPKQNRERLTQILFEDFNVLAMYIGISATLTLYASGRTSGVVLDSGCDVSYAVPIHEGYCLPHAIQVLDFGGRTITSALKRQIKLCLKYPETIQMKLLDNVKKEHCYLAIDFYEEMKNFDSALEKPIHLIDENFVKLGRSAFEVPEKVLFGERGIHEAVYNSIMKCSFGDRREFFSNIVLGGGNTLIKGLADRLTKEITALALPGYRIKVVAIPERANSSWIGGSILASLETFQEMWVLREEYDKHGPGIVHKKCF
eukprot:augustus_masked-scaffold_17-processed-gene-6.6-mRNA-1 protein AED:0.30 eAED:0.30 QI:0/-1/0/1/-1/1/1/0/362